MSGVNDVTFRWNCITHFRAKRPNFVLSLSNKLNNSKSNSSVIMSKPDSSRSNRIAIMSKLKNSKSNNKIITSKLKNNKAKREIQKKDNSQLWKIQTINAVFFKMR
jgi:hypothetical protein